MKEEESVVEMVKCDACGELHKKDECETVIVRYIKGKNCSLSQQTTNKEMKTLNEERFLENKTMPTTPTNGSIPKDILNSMTPPPELRK